MTFISMDPSGWPDNDTYQVASYVLGSWRAGQMRLSLSLTVFVTVASSTAILYDCGA
jgi:hypothetical protein